MTANREKLDYTYHDYQHSLFDEARTAVWDSTADKEQHDLFIYRDPRGQDETTHAQWHTIHEGLAQDKLENERLAHFARAAADYAKDAKQELLKDPDLYPDLPGQDHLMVDRVDNLDANLLLHTLTNVTDRSHYYPFPNGADPDYALHNEIIRMAKQNEWEHIPAKLEAMYLEASEHQASFIDTTTDFRAHKEAFNEYIRQLEDLDGDDADLATGYIVQSITAQARERAERFEAGIEQRERFDPHTDRTIAKLIIGDIHQRHDEAQQLITAGLTSKDNMDFDTGINEVEKADAQLRELEKGTTGHIFTDYNRQVDYISMNHIRSEHLNDALHAHLSENAGHLFEDEAHPWLDEAPQETHGLMYHADFQDAFREFAGNLDPDDQQRLIELLAHRSSHEFASKYQEPGPDFDALYEETSRNNTDDLKRMLAGQTGNAG